MKSQYFESLPQALPMNHIMDVLRTVKSAGLDIFIVTGSGQLSLLDKLNHYFPDVFHREKMVTAFDVKRGKPDPEPYLMALKKCLFCKSSYRCGECAVGGEVCGQCRHFYGGCQYRHSER